MKSVGLLMHLLFHFRYWFLKVISNIKKQMERRIERLEMEVLLLRDTIIKLQTYTAYNVKFGDKLKRFIYLATDILPRIPLSNGEERYDLKNVMIDMGNIIDYGELTVFLKRVQIMSINVLYSIEFRNVLLQLHTVINDTVDFDNIPGNFF